MMGLCSHPSGSLSTGRSAGHAPSALTSSVFHGRTLQTNQPVPLAAQGCGLIVEAKYRGIGTDRSKVAQFQRKEADTGSTEVQIARISARVEQLTGHLQQHRKDYAATRGLTILLGQRRRLMRYLYQQNRPKYDEIIRTLSIRPLKVQAARGIMVKLTAEPVKEPVA